MKCLVSHVPKARLIKEAGGPRYGTNTYILPASDDGSLAVVQGSETGLVLSAKREKIKGCVVPCLSAPVPPEGRYLTDKECVRARKYSVVCSPGVYFVKPLVDGSACRWMGDGFDFQGFVLTRYNYRVLPVLRYPVPDSGRWLTVLEDRALLALGFDGGGNQDIEWLPDRSGCVISGMNTGDYVLVQKA